MLVIGKSRQGKSRDIQRFQDKFNSGSEIMPDGRPARVVRCILSGKVTWKDLGRGWQRPGLPVSSVHLTFLADE